MSRQEKVLVSDYSNSLHTAISSIGSTPTQLIINADSTLSTSETVPATLILEFRDGAKLTKSQSGALQFAGFGLQYPESRDPNFSGFAAGDITWTGSDYPSRLSVDLWDDTDVMAKVTLATNAMAGKKTTLIAYPGSFATTNNTLKAGHSLYFTRGDYTSSVSTTGAILLYLESDTCVYGDGMTVTKLYGPTATSCDRIFAASGMNGALYMGLDGYNENIEIRDLMLVNSDPTKTYPDTGASAILLGNCTNGHVRRVCIKDYPAYGIYIGGFPTASRAFTDGNVTIGTGNIAITGHGRTTGSVIMLKTTGTLPVPSGRLSIYDRYRVFCDSGRCQQY